MVIAYKILEYENILQPNNIQHTKNAEIEYIVIITLFVKQRDVVKVSVATKLIKNKTIIIFNKNKQNFFILFIP